MPKKSTLIISAANFKTHISKYLKDIDEEQEPVFLTVNGQGSHVIMHVATYDELRSYKQYCWEHAIVNPRRGIVDNQKKPLAPAFYDVLAESYKDEWDSYTPQQLEELRKSIEEEREWHKHWAECIGAKIRAYDSIAPEGKQLGGNVVKHDK